MLVSIFGNTCQETSLEDLCAFIKKLHNANINIEIEQEFYDWLYSKGALQSLCSRTANPSPNSDMVISAGGDGTLLKAAYWAADRKIPVAGLNTGHLGFLTAWHIKDSSALVDAIISNTLNIEERTLIKASSPELPDNIWPFALNDISLLKENSGSMITVKTSIDGIYLTDYEADGLLIATPSGSTAYNLSAGGPILQPTAPALVLTPVAPHTLTMRPLVVCDTATISTVTTSRAGRFLLSIDGNTISLPAGSQIEISRADFSLKLVRRAGDNFGTALRDKLLWGASLTSGKNS